MNKLTKVGLSALCGSLAAVSSAYAGEMSVSGSANATWTKLGGKNQTTGNPLGMASALSFTGTGELDGGQEVKLVIDHTDQNAWSAGTITLTTNSLGTFNLNQAGGGNGIGGYDDNMPRAWEEVWDTGVGVGADMAKGVGSSTNVQWKSPSIANSTLAIAYAPKNDRTQNNDKANSAAGNPKYGSGVDILLDISPSFDMFSANLFAGYSVTELDSAQGAGLKDRTSDHEEGTAGLTLTFGPIKAGVQKTAEFTASQVAGEEEYYANTSWGVSFNVNDNLSVSYAEFSSQKNYVGKEVGANDDSSGNTEQQIDADSIQLAYTMGGASIKIADTDVNNAKYVTDGTGDVKGTSVMLSLAF